MSSSAVSVLLPLHNCENTISVTMDSLCEQDFKDFTLVAVDNNCSDKTMDVVESYSDRLDINSVSCTIPGIVPALNTGLKHCNSKYVARIDGDDSWYPTKLGKQFNFLEKNTHVGVLGTQIEIYDVAGKSQPMGTMGRPVNYPIDDNTIKSLLLMGQNPICHPSVMVRRELLDFTGGYESFFHKAEDLHLWLKLIPHTKFANLDEKLTKYTQKQDKDYDARVPLLASEHYYLLYKAIGLVEGERPNRVYDWQRDPTLHGNVRT